MDSSRHDIEESFHFLDNIFNNIPSGLFIANSKGSLQACNKTFLRLFDRKDDRIAAKPLEEILPCRQTAGREGACGEGCEYCTIRRVVEETFAKQSSAADMITREQAANGEKKNQYLKLSTKMIEHRREKFALVIVDDVTDLEEQKRELKKKNQNLQEINDQKNRFVGIAAHDLRNPISAMQACSALILQSLETAPKAEVRELLQIIVAKSKFSLNLINDLLDISKIEAGHLDLDLKPQDFGKFLKENIKINALLAGGKNIDVLLNIEGKPPVFSFDINKMEQVMNNLIGNAVKYSNPGTTVTVSARVEGGRMAVSVADQGPGIPESELSQVFKAFHRASSETNSVEKSSGLGLAIVKKIVEGHGGTVDVTSEVKKGSVFSFCIPLTAGPRQQELF